MTTLIEAIEQMTDEDANVVIVTESESSDRIINRLAARIQRLKQEKRAMQESIRDWDTKVRQRDDLIALLRDRVHQANASGLPVDVP